MQNEKNNEKKPNLRNILIWGVLGLFVLSGMMQGDMFGMHNPVVATVGKAKIKVADVRKYMNLIKVPDDVDRDEPNVRNYIFTKALDLIIQRSLITQECKRLGLVVSDAKVIETIQRDIQFHDKGRFSRSKFLTQLGKLGFSEMEYKSIQKENLLHKQWLFMLESSYKIPDAIAINVAKCGIQKRSGRYIEISHSSIKIPTQTSLQLQKFYKDNISLFKEDKKKIFRILELVNVKSVETIDHLLRKQKFDQVVSKFHAKIYASNKIDSDLPENINDVLEQLNFLQVGQNTILYSLNGKYYAFQFQSETEARTPEFIEVKDKVSKAFKEDYIKSHAVPGNREFVRLMDVKLGESYLGVPDIIINGIFMSKPGNLKRIEGKGVTYYYITDKIVNSSPTQEQIEGAKGYLSSSLLNDIVFSSLHSLKLRYNIKSNV